MKRALLPTGILALKCASKLFNLGDKEIMPRFDNAQVTVLSAKGQSFNIDPNSSKVRQASIVRSGSSTSFSLSSKVK